MNRKEDNEEKLFASNDGLTMVEQVKNNEENTKEAKED